MNDVRGMQTAMAVNCSATDPPPAAAEPSAWVCRWAPLIRPGGRVLDLACGRGRHARHLAALGYRVEAVDRDADALATLAGIDGISIRNADLEAAPWPYAKACFTGIVVTNYLHRPMFPLLLAALARDGVLIYETFATGNECYGPPRNPDFLLRPGELLELVRGRLRVKGYEDLFTASPRPAMVQRLCAVKASDG